MTENKIIFVFINGGGLTKNQWYNHPYKNNSIWLERNDEKYKTNLISKIKKFGKVYLYTPKFNISIEDIKNDKTFTIQDIDLNYHCKQLYKKIKNYQKIFLISHSRGWIIAKYFISYHSKKICGYINIDGGETVEYYKDRLKIWEKDYGHINDTKLIELFQKIKNNDEKSYNILSQFVKYKIYKQDLENNYNYKNINMIILNNIYNDEEISISDKEYIDSTLKSKFAYNKQFEHNKKIKSIYYVGKTHFLYFYNDVISDIIDIITNIISK